jgi:methanogenic corrinoid protein MtbC1
MTGFPSSMQGDFSHRAPNGGGGQDPSLAFDSFKFPRPERGVRQGASLARMVESEIIPRLMLAHRTLQAAPKPPAAPDGPLGEQTTEMFARMVVSKEPDSLLAFVGTLLERGISIEAIYLELLVPAARRLGDFWDTDTASFAEVTIGLGRLQQLVRALGWKTPNDHESRLNLPSALFAAVPGEGHTFGLFIIEDSFRRAGWRTWIETAMARQELADTVRSHWFDVFGLSASRDTRIDDMSETIRTLRQFSRNRDLFILVGGRLFTERPELVASVGADATAAVPAEALLIANEALLIADNRVRRVASGS